MARKVEVRYSVKIEQEEMDYRGNCSAVDEETDRTTEEWIRSELARGNVAAWCWVRVVAEVAGAPREVDGFEGSDSLGGCSYRSMEELEAQLLPEMRAGAVLEALP